MFLLVNICDNKSETAAYWCSKINLGRGSNSAAVSDYVLIVTDDLRRSL